jgi:hypothetical protein
LDERELNGQFRGCSASIPHSLRIASATGSTNRKEIRMFNMLRNAAISAIIGVSALTGMAVTAQAEGLYLNFGGHGESRVGVYVGDDGPRHVGRWDRGERNRWDRRECTPGRALNKAERLGVRRARVIDVNRRTIDVAGRRHGDRVVVTFARAPHCPVIG